jgi:hypothetical protein
MIRVCLAEFGYVGRDLSVVKGFGFAEQLLNQNLNFMLLHADFSPRQFYEHKKRKTERFVLQIIDGDVDVESSKYRSVL